MTAAKVDFLKLCYNTFGRFGQVLKGLIAKLRVSIKVELTEIPEALSYDSETFVSDVWDTRQV